MKSVVSKLPTYLQKYCSSQDYSIYTSQDHAVWRYIMRQSRAFFYKHAHSIYLEGLDKTGISITSIPKVEEIDQKLSKFGWGAVPVSGFIPPAAFMTFQALKILPIATQMRRIENIAYTPAPDIVHEAAGHAPILADKGYREYLEQYADVARNSIISKQDLDIYEAIRTLSDIKEDPNATEQSIQKSQEALDKSLAAVTYTSEATKASRMAWWTTEYGLVKEGGAVKIYGAGLLSSVSESQNYLSDSVKKIPLTAGCADVGYDITKPQPQLFVAENIQHLKDVLEDFSKTLSYKCSPSYGLEQAKLSQIVNTLNFASGLQLSSRLVDFDLVDDKLKAVCIDPMKGQLCYLGKEIFKVCFEESKQWIHIEDSTPNNAELSKGEALSFENLSGICDEVLKNDKDEVLAVVLKDCKLESSLGSFTYKKSFVVFSSLEKITGGTADRNSFGDFDMGQASTDPGVKPDLDDSSQELMTIYQSIRDFRESKQTKNVSSFIAETATLLNQNHCYEWLAFLELMELNMQHTSDQLASFEWYKVCAENLMKKYQGTHEEWLLHQGTTLLYTED